MFVEFRGLKKKILKILLKRMIMEKKILKKSTAMDIKKILKKSKFMTLLVLEFFLSDLIYIGSNVSKNPS